jgi:putative glutamine amidotransferase
MSFPLPLPVVGIPCCVKQIGIHPFHTVGEKYINAVAHGSGAMPLLIPAFGGGEDLDPLTALVSLDDLLDKLDGVFVTGSPSNVHPSLYGGHEPRTTTLLDPQRDALTLALIRHAVLRGVPVFAVCRGIQEMNAAFGGTLFQHVQEVPGRFDHRADESLSRPQQYEPVHDIEVTPGGLLQQITGLERYKVNSLHAQGIDRPAETFQVEAVAPDSQIEAVSVKDAPGFALGVQWHPEWRYHERAHDHALFTAFGEACRAYAAAKARGDHGERPGQVA